MFHIIPVDVFLHITKFLSPEDENTLIRTNHVFKEYILLVKRLFHNYYYLTLPNVNSYLFNVLERNYSWLPTIQSIFERLTIILDGFDSICKLKHVVLAGGSLVNILDQRISNEELKKSGTDLDFFIYGNNEQKETVLLQITKFLSSFAPKYYIRSNVIDVFIKGRRHIQLVIMNEVRHPYEIVNGFDLGYVQLFYDGYGLYGTHLAVVSFRDHCTIATCLLLQKDRQQKAKKKGFEIRSTNLATNIIPQKETTIRNRFFLTCIQRVMDEEPGWKNDTDIFSTLLDEIDVEEIIQKFRLFDVQYGMSRQKFPPYFGDIFLENNVLASEPVNYMNMKHISLVYRNESPFIVTTCPVRVNYHDNNDFNVDTKSYLRLFPSKLDSFIDRMKDIISEKMRLLYHNFGSFEQVLPSRIKYDKNTVIVDKFSLPYTKKIKENDEIICEIAFNGYYHMDFYLCRRKYFVIRASKIIVL
jgi:hypothetical protein